VHAQPLVLASAALLLGGAVFLGGGSDDGSLLWIGGAASVVVAAFLVLLSPPRIGFAGAGLVAFLGALVLWSGISIVWSIQPDRSWSSFNRGLTYLALLGLGTFVGAVARRAPRDAAAGLAVVLGLAVAWALAGKIVPTLGPELDRSARLRAPIGYWNALALLIATSLPLWLWVAARRSHGARIRAGATAVLAASLVALLLTTSRGGILVGAVAIGVWLVLTRPRLEAAVALLIAAPVAAAVAFWALGRPALAEAGAASGDAARDGAVFGLLLVLALTLVFGLALASAPEERRRLAQAAVSVGAALAVIGLAVAFVRVDVGAAWGEFRNPPAVQVPQGPERVVSFSSNHRWTWWRESARVFENHPLAGTGAGTFALARKPVRKDTQAPLAPHNVGLQALSETGIVGFALLLGVVGSAGWAVASALRRLGGEDRAAAAALAAGLAAYLAHSLVDMGWEYVAVSAPFFLALGILLTAGGSPGSRGRRRPIAALGIVALAAFTVTSLATPWLGERRVDDAYAALEQGDLATAAATADRAAGLNPLSIEPLHAGALAEELRGNLAEAERLLRQAVELQPENGETWYELGRFEFESRGELRLALRHLDRSYALDSFGPAGPVLDEVRAAIAARR